MTRLGVKPMVKRWILSQRLKPFRESVQRMCTGKLFEVAAAVFKNTRW